MPLLHDEGADESTLEEYNKRREERLASRGFHNSKTVPSSLADNDQENDLCSDTSSHEGKLQLEKIFGTLIWSKLKQ